MNVTITAREVRPGMRYRSLGRGYIARTVQSVEEMCNCEARSGRIDPQTRERIHEPAVVIVSDSLTSYLTPDTPCVIDTEPGL